MLEKLHKFVLKEKQKNEKDYWIIVKFKYVIGC